MLRLFCAVIIRSIYAIRPSFAKELIKTKKQPNLRWVAFFNKIEVWQADSNKDAF
jgi:hypothetical protein